MSKTSEVEAFLDGYYLGLMEKERTISDMDGYGDPTMPTYSGKVTHEFQAWVEYEKVLGEDAL